DEKVKHGPLYVFSVFAIITAALTFLLPETSKHELPDTVEEAEMLSKHQNEELDSLQQYTSAN
ncbi:hypothetical protein L9F63_024193, partial [Diploptera punctata]